MTDLHLRPLHMLHTPATPLQDTPSVNETPTNAHGEELIPAQHATTTFDAASKHERISAQPFRVRAMRHTVLGAFGVWTKVSNVIARQLLGWFPRVEPYIGYGTGSYSRLICRTVYAPATRTAGMIMRGIRALLMVPAAHTQVKISIDSTPLVTVQVGDSASYDAVDAHPDLSSKYAVSDTQGYLDLVAERELEPGKHDVSYAVAHREPVHSTLYTIPADAKVGIISDVDDTIMVTQAPILWRAAYNLLFLNPRKRLSVPSMSVFYSKLQEQFPDAPFFYLSTSPWNVEGSIRHCIEYHGFPEGPLLLRDLDPRPKTFIQSGVQHKLEFVEQLMADFPQMKFILLGDDGQKDPTTYATIARRYEGRVLAIGIRQLNPGESGIPLQKMAGVTATQPAPALDVPVFYGTTGKNLMKTMLPYLQSLHD
ncbi:App1 family protein [Bifidobacterium simiarum]|uniref:ABC transporter ATP-binding protein n=1 Tax=Bifidobacterium simiarum TaxID=2045441 RepID=A0A2M9HF69_9BIFI|nr:phosphatase domain-containing protein [Bifidobacterium simiarum]MBT1165503.1 DUF2183 domain-containing protein [Bifidobacterium simiarum]PJM75451.1 ABC transporter ATP-binding protein [Bifidobacterium simiarum]